MCIRQMCSLDEEGGWNWDIQEHLQEGLDSFPTLCKEHTDQCQTSIGKNTNEYEVFLNISPCQCCHE